MKGKQGFGKAAMETHFAPAGRDTREELEQGAVLVEKTALLGAVLDAIPSGVLILNEKRQVLAANRSLLRMLDVRREEILGKRPGEIVGCAVLVGGKRRLRHRHPLPDVRRGPGDPR